MTELTILIHNCIWYFTYICAISSYFWTSSLFVSAVHIKGDRIQPLQFSSPQFMMLVTSKTDLSSNSNSPGKDYRAWLDVHIGNNYNAKEDPAVIMLKAVGQLIVNMEPGQTSSSFYYVSMCAHTTSLLSFHSIPSKVQLLI